MGDARELVIADWCPDTGRMSLTYEVTDPVTRAVTTVVEVRAQPTQPEHEYWRFRGASMLIL